MPRICPALGEARRPSRSGVAPARRGGEGHSPSSFMARRYSSSKDSFITAQVAWQICGSMGTGAVGKGTGSEPFPCRKCRLVGPRPSLQSPPCRPAKTWSFTKCCPRGARGHPQSNGPSEVNKEGPASPRLVLSI